MGRHSTQHFTAASHYSSQPHHKTGSSWTHLTEEEDAAGRGSRLAQDGTERPSQGPAT